MYNIAISPSCSLVSVIYNRAIIVKDRALSRKRQWGTGYARTGLNAGCHYVDG
jgi:hypothetical protein